MRDGPLDSLDRTRVTFLASIGDGIGKADAGADFYFATLNAERHGYVLKDSDKGLLNMFNSIIKDDINEPYDQTRDPTLSARLGGTSLPTGEEQQEQRAAQFAPTGQEAGYQQSLQHEGQGIPETMWDADRTIRPRVGQSHAGRDFETARGEVGTAYANRCAIRHGPLYHRGHGDDTTAMVDTVSNFYLPDDAYAESQSEIDGKKELAWDKYHSTGEHDFVLGARHYGQLPENMTNHHQYESHLDTWKAENSAMIGEEENRLRELGHSDDEIGHAIKQMHMADAKQRWMSNDRDENGIPEKLGLMDYLFGLEWHTPAQRHKIYEHMKEHGLSSEGRADIENGLSHSARLIRNFQQRFAPMYNHWVRAGHAGGETFEHTTLGTGIEPPTPRMRFQALDTIRHGYEKAVEHWENATGNKLVRYPPKKADGTPHPKAGVLKQHLEAGPDGKLQIKEGSKPEIRNRTLLALMNIDPRNNELYTPGNHPHIKDWQPSNGPFTQEEYNHVKKQIGKLNSQSRAGRIGRNAGGMHYYAHVDPNAYNSDVTNHGDGKGLAYHWNQPFKGIGGMMSHPNTLFNLLHEHGISLHDSKMDESGNPEPTKDNFGWTESLLFNRSPLENQIRLRVLEDPQRGGTAGAGGSSRIQDGMMMSALAPFGQPSPQLTQFQSKSRKTGEMYAATRVEHGDIGDSEENLHGHGGFMHSKGTRVEPAFRTAHHSSPAYANWHRQNHKEAMEDGDLPRAKKSKDAFHGITAGSIPITQSLSGARGGYAHGIQNARRKLSSMFYRFSTALGFGNPPLSPSHEVADMNMPRKEVKPTAPTHEVIAALGHPQYLDDPVLEQGSDNLSHSLEEQNRLFDQIEHLTRQIDESDNDAEKENLTSQRSDLRTEMNNLAASIDAAGPTSPRQQTRTEREVLQSHTNAITERALAHLPHMDPALFDRGLPLDILRGNVMQYASMINQMLAREPHENHGFTVRGNAIGDTMTKLTVGRGTAYNRPKDMSVTPSDVKHFVHNSSQFRGKANHSPEELAKGLGLDYENAHVQATMQRLSNRIRDMAHSQGDMELEFPMMTAAQLMSRGGHYGEHGTPEEMRNAVMGAINMGTSGKAKQDPNFMHIKRNKDVLENQLAEYESEFGGMGRTAKEGVGELSDDLGLHFHTSHTTDPSKPSELTRGRGKRGSKGAKGVAGQNRELGHRVLQSLDSVLFSDPTKDPKKVTTVDAKVQQGLADTKLGPMDSRSESVIHSLYNSSGFNSHFGDKVRSTFGWKVDHNGMPKVYPTDHPNEIRLNGPLQHFWNIFDGKEGRPYLLDILHPDYVHHDGQRAQDFHKFELMGNQFRPHPRTKYRWNQDPTLKAEIMNLAALTNPDVIRKELGDKVPLLQPMHRIFELDDLEHLRGFTGDWIVSVMPEGERGFVIKEGDKVTSPNFSLSKDDKKNFKEVADEDFRLDVIKLEDGYYVFDVLEFDEKEVHDTVLNDRIKIIRGGMEGIENIHVPSASDTRLTDDAGLEAAVEQLQEENERVLLRDAKSTYMAGELRHPKWVLLSPGNDVVLMVLERRGSLPYTYRLGTGPITQEDSLGQRGVEVNGKTYMDMGAAFDSSEKFNVGDHVRVNVANVGEMETNGHNLYSVTGSEIIGEAEGEGLVSQETLSLLAKSESQQWLCEINRAAGGIRIAMPQGDVVYKTTQSGRLWTVHSPLAPNHYLIRLAESQRPYWAPVAGAILKADVEIAEKEAVEESQNDAKPLIKPKKIEGTSHWKKGYDKVLVKGMLLVERMVKSGVGSVGTSSTGAMGLGIGYATPIESPTGPTNLHDSKTMPDYDNKRRPGEDYSIEPDTEEEEGTKHITVPLKEGTLEVSDSTARFHS